MAASLYGKHIVSTEDSAVRGRGRWTRVLTEKEFSGSNMRLVNRVMPERQHGESDISQMFREFLSSEEGKNRPDLIRGVGIRRIAA